MSRKLLLSLIFILTSFYSPQLALAQGGGQSYPTQDEVNAVAKKLYCPVCPNTPLDVCETQACIDWRSQIRDQLAGGWNEQQILDYFVEQYGERVLAEPLRSGFNSLVWLMPVIFVILGLVILWQVLKSWRSGNEIQQVNLIPEQKISSELIAQIEKEIRELN